MVKGGIRSRVGGQVGVALVGVSVRVYRLTRGGGESGVRVVVFRVDFDPQPAEPLTNSWLNFLARERGERRG